MVYAHHCEVQLIAVNEVLGVMVSYDISGIVLMHTFPKGKYLHEFFIDAFVENEEQDKIMQMEIHDNGLILFLTKLSKVLVYTYNAELYYALEVYSRGEERITRIKWLSSLYSDIVSVLWLMCRWSTRRAGTSGWRTSSC